MAESRSSLDPPPLRISVWLVRGLMFFFSFFALDTGATRTVCLELTHVAADEHFTEICSGSEAGSYLSLIDSCITQLKAQGPSRTCNERKEEEEEEVSKLSAPLWCGLRGQQMPSPRHGHLWRCKWTDLSGPLSWPNCFNFILERQFLPRNSPTGNVTYKHFQSLVHGIRDFPCGFAEVRASSSSLLLSSLDMSDTQSLSALNTSPPRNQK